MLADNKYRKSQDISPTRLWCRRLDGIAEGLPERIALLLLAQGFPAVFAAQIVPTLAAHYEGSAVSTAFNSSR